MTSSVQDISYKVGDRFEMFLDLDTGVFEMKHEGKDIGTAKVSGNEFYPYIFMGWKGLKLTTTVTFP